MQNQIDQSEQINVSAIMHRTWKKKWAILAILIITFALSCCYIFPVPRYYKSSIDLAPEFGDMGNPGGSLSDIASSMGINVGNSMLSDAITPEFYPQLMKSNNFIIHLIDCPIKTSDGKVSTTYFTYLEKYQKKNPLSKPFVAIKKLFSPKPQPVPAGHKLDPFRLTKKEDGIFNIIRDKIKCNVDKKTNLITIIVEDQDPLVAAIMAKQTSEQLKDFISDYRTSKARKDLDYYKKLTASAKLEYEKSRQIYGSYSDANTDVLLESYKLKMEDLENDMQLKFNNYSALNSQLQAAKAKVLEKTPVFTSLSEASVPLKPAGPKRMLFVMSMVFIAFLVSTIYFSRDLIF